MLKRYNIKLFGSTLLFLLFFVILHAQPGWSDEFNVTQLAAGWIWDNPANDSSHSLTDKIGWVSITIAKGEHNVWNQRGLAPMLVFKTSEMNYSIDAHLLVSGAFNQASAGLIIIDKAALKKPTFSGTWGALVLHSDGNVRWTQDLSGTPKELFRLNLDNGLPKDEACLKIVRRGDKWEMLYESPNEKDNEHGWKSMGTTILNLQGEHLVGLVAMNSANAPAYISHFDYLRTTPANLVESGLGLSVDSQGKLSTIWGKMKSAY